MKEMCPISHRFRSPLVSGPFEFEPWRTPRKHPEGADPWDCFTRFVALPRNKKRGAANTWNMFN